MAERIRFLRKPVPLFEFNIDSLSYKIIQIKGNMFSMKGKKDTTVIILAPDDNKRD